MQYVYGSSPKPFLKCMTLKMIKIEDKYNIT